MGRVYEMGLPEDLGDITVAVTLQTWEAADGWRYRLSWASDGPNNAVYGPFPDACTALGQAMIAYYCELDPDTTHNDVNLISLEGL